MLRGMTSEEFLDWLAYFILTGRVKWGVPQTVEQITTMINAWCAGVNAIVAEEANLPISKRSIK